MLALQLIELVFGVHLDVVAVRGAVGLSWGLRLLEGCGLQLHWVLEGMCGLDMLS